MLCLKTRLEYLLFSNCFFQCILGLEKLFVITQACPKQVWLVRGFCALHESFELDKKILTKKKCSKQKYCMKKLSFLRVK